MYAVKSWDKFQHYKDRNPPWIKLHKNLLDDFQFQSLPLASRALAPMLWLIASEHENPKSGFIEGPDEQIAFRLRLSCEEFRLAINPLIDKGFINLASTPLADCKHIATPETETETETENRGREHKNGFSKSWKGNGYAKQKPTSGTEAVEQLFEKWDAGTVET